jgi:hypothetical protein
MTLRRRFLHLGASLPLAASVAACGSSTAAPVATGPLDAGTFDSGPVAGTYTIVFPSLDFPVYADEIQVFVFAAGDAESQCIDLIQAQKGGGTLPPAIAPTQGISPCKLNGGAGDLSIPFGNFAVLVAVERGGQDIAIGCQQQVVSATSPTMTITVDGVGATVPTTTCTTLSAFCANSCG